VFRFGSSFKGLVSHDGLEPSVLCFEFLQSLGIIGLHSTISVLPSMPGGLADAKAPSNLSDSFALVQHLVALCEFCDDLIWCVQFGPTWAYLPYLLWSVFSHFGWITYGTPTQLHRTRSERRTTDQLRSYTGRPLDTTPQHVHKISRAAGPFYNTSPYRSQHTTTMLRKKRILRSESNEARHIQY